MVNAQEAGTARTVVRPHRPGWRALASLVGAESRMVVRDTAGLVVPLGLPVLILVMNGLSLEGEMMADGRSVMDVYVLPLVATVIVATIGVINMPSFLGTYRKEGVLARLELTPVSPLLVLVAQVIVSIAQTIVGVIIALAVAVGFFGASLPAAPWLAAGVFLVVAAAMYAVGMLVAAIAPTPNASLAIGLGVFFAMAAVGGMFGPVENLPDGVARVGEVLPFGAGVNALSEAWNGGSLSAPGLIALAVAIAIPGAAAARLFRWT